MVEAVLFLMVKYFKEWIFCVNIVVINILFTIKVSTPFKGEAKDRIYMLIALILTFSQWEKERPILIEDRLIITFDFL